MFNMQKVKEFLNDLGNSINEFTTIPQQNDHQTRDGQQVRRRSSWSDIPSFFKFNRDPPTTTTTTTETVPGQTTKQSMSTMTQSGNMNQGNYNSQIHQQQSINNGNPMKHKSLNRTPSLRTNSNGNVVPTHRRVSNNGVHSLQLDSKGSGGSLRYQSNKQQRSLYTNSAPPTPRGVHGGPNSWRHDFSNQGSPVPSRRHTSSSSSLPNHRRGTSLPNSNFNDINQREHRSNSYGSKHFPDQRLLDYQQTQQPYDSRNRIDNRRNNNNLPFSHSRPELSKENLEQFNQYSSSSTVSSNSVLNNNMYYQDQPLDRRGMNNMDFYRENRSTRSHPDLHLGDHRQMFRSETPEKYSLNDLRNIENRDRSQYNKYNKHNTDLNYKSIESYSDDGSFPLHYNDHPDQYKRHPIDPRLPVDHRLSVDVGRNNVDIGRNSSLPLGVGESYNRKENIDNRQMYSSYPHDMHDEFKRERMSPKRNANLDNELFNGVPSQMYYDNMISQISSQIARASEGRMQQKPFNPTIPRNHTEEDDNEWC